jgi:DNA polymerase-1
MRHLKFAECPTYAIAILVPEIRRDAILDAYVTPHAIDPANVIVLDLHQDVTKKKTPAAQMKQYAEEELAPTLLDLGVEYLIVADAEYFKILTKQAKAEPHLGYVLDCAFGPQKVVYVPSYKAIFYDPEKVRSKVSQGISALIEHRTGAYTLPGADIIQSALYPTAASEIEIALTTLHRYPELTCDIEGFSLKHYSSGIATICFCWDQHNGIAFPLDYLGRDGAGELLPTPDAARVRASLRKFFEEYQGKLTYHSIAFDVYILVYQLFMKDILDTEGLLYGLSVMLKNWDCTKLITYLATNSCAGNRLDLKSNSQEFSGNYSVGEDIKDVTQIELPRLLEYNLIDGLSTWFVKNKFEPVMDADQQRQIYEELFKPAIWDIVQMQLTGMPVNMPRAIEVNDKLATEEAALRAKILLHPQIKKFETDYLEPEHIQKRNSKLKAKRIQAGDEPQTFNPGSDPQRRAFFFDWLQLPIISLTDSKLPSTDGETIEAWINRTATGEVDPALKDLLETFQLLAIIETLTSNFMPAILNAVEGPDGWHYLFGNFNLGGTLSGRLSSSGPNLQNLPSTGKGHKIKLVYAKLIKSCFQAPPGWLFVGADFPSLEDRISALTTKDPNKLKVYTDGYDGHSLRAFAYFGSQMSGIIDTVASINTIQKLYKPLRDRSKNPTFTLTYQGTYHALMKKYGFSEQQAKDVEAKYHELYKVSDNWVNAKLDDAMRCGYITAAFGLRLRTPLLKQVIRGTSKTPYEAEAEGRTAGNALGQSWCLLNSRAASEFLGKVRSSKHRLDIRPSAQIHDAQYYIIRDDITVVKYVNDHLPAAMAWQEHPDIYHEEVKLAGAKVGIFYPNWNTEIELPNGASEEEIFAVIDNAMSEKTQ